MGEYGNYNTPKVELPDKLSSLKNLPVDTWIEKGFGDPVIGFNVLGIKETLVGKAGGYTGKTESDKVFKDVGNFYLIFLNSETMNVLKKVYDVGDKIDVKFFEKTYKFTLKNWSRGSGTLFRLRKESITLKDVQVFDLLKKGQNRMFELTS